jgi:hypothetical protein
MRTDMVPYHKTPQKVLSVIIDEHGNLEYLKTDSCDVLLELGETVTRRASHVEPADLTHRIAFHLLRSVVNDKSRIAAWTRTWNCLWRVNTAPVGGPILTWEHVAGFPTRCLSWWYIFDGHKQIATWANRQDAIDAEIRFLNEFLLTR